MGTGKQSASGTPERIDGHFDVLELLGAGGMGAVYRVRDGRDGRQLALKTLTGVDDENLQRRLHDMFRREYRTLQQLEHPAVIEVYDYGVADEGAYYTMELLGGSDLHALAPAPWREVCRYMRDICSALALLHSRRLLHRDVSPRNVRCLGEQAKLIDFGTMATLGASHQLVGTPPLIPPEAVERQVLDARSDLYAVGATLYFALTRRHAYPARTLAVLAQVWRQPPAPPSTLVAGIPPALDALVMSLLSHRVEARPASAAEVMDRLTSLADLPSVDRLRVRNAYLATPELVGRAQSVAAIRSDLAAIKQGQKRQLTFRGEAGLGRSRLLDATLLEARLEGADTLRVQPADLREGTCAIAPFLLEQLGALVAGRARKQSRPGGLTVARTASTQLKARDVRGLISRARALVRRATHERPLVLAVDDADELDPASQALLSTLDSATRRGLLLVLTVSDHGALEPPLQTRSMDGSTIELQPLTAEQTEHLLCSVFGDVPRLPVLAASLHALGAGRPRAMIELAQHLVDEGALHYELGHWVLPAQIDQALPRAWTHAVDARLQGLPTDVLQFATLLAFAVSYSRDPLLLGRLLSRGDGEQEPALDALLIADLFRVEGRSYGFASEGIAQRLRERATPETRRRLHAELTAWLRENDRDAIEVARCELAAGQEAGAIDSLLGVLEVGTRWDTAPADYAGLLLQAMDACNRLGRPKRERFMLLSELVHVGEHMGVPDMRAHFRELFDILTVESSLTAYQALPDDMDPGQRLGEAFNGAQARYDAQPAHERILPPAEAIRALSVAVGQAAGFGAAAMDYELQKMVPSIAPFVPLSPAIAAALEGTLPAALHLTAGRYEAAYDAYTVLLARLEQPDHAGLDDDFWRWATGAVRFALGHIHAGLGIGDCLARAEALELDPAWVAPAWDVRRAYYQRMGSDRDVGRCRDRIERLVLEGGRRPPIVDTSARLELDTAARAGDLPAAKRAMERMRALIAMHPGYAPYRHFGPALFEHLRGNQREALGQAERALALTSAETHPTWACIANLLLYVLIELDRVEEARLRAEQFLVEAEASQLGVMAILIAGPLAIAEALQGDFESAVRRLDEAAQCCERLRMTGGDIGWMFELRARVAIWMGDEEGFVAGAERCALEYGRGLGSSRLARYERLRNEARDAGMGTGSMQPPPMPDVITESSLSALQYTALGTGTDAQRYDTALSLLVAESGAMAGQLYELSEGAPVLRAESAEATLRRLPPCEPPTVVNGFPDDEHDEGDPDDDIATATALGEDGPAHGGSAWLPINLGYTGSDAGFHRTGIAQLYFEAPPRSPSMELVEAVARLFQPSGEADAEPGAVGAEALPETRVLSGNGSGQ